MLPGFGRDLIPQVLAGLVRRGEDFDDAEDALQEALLEALRVWPEHPPRDPRAWLTTVATRRLVGARRRGAARRRRGGERVRPRRGGPSARGGDELRGAAAGRGGGWASDHRGGRRPPLPALLL